MLLEALSGDVKTVPEAARRVLATQRKIGGSATGEQDPAAFIHHMLKTMQDDYRSASGLTLFDRGLPDLLAFCTYYQTPMDEVRGAIKAMRYQPFVLFLPAWREIYQTDNERRLDADGAAGFGARTLDAYRQSRYVILEVPKLSVAERRAFVLDHLDV